MGGSCKRNAARSNAENPVEENHVNQCILNASVQQPLMMENVCEESMERVVADSSRRTDVRCDCENPVEENLANGHIVYVVEQGTVSLEAHSMMAYNCENEPEGEKQKQLGPFHHCRRCCANLLVWRIRTLVLSVALLIAIAIIFYQSGKRCQVPAAPSPPGATSPSLDASSCPQHWVRNGSQCFQPSSTQETWNTSQKICSSQGGSLVTMETPEEKEFVLNSRLPKYFWLGLRRKGESWQRADGSLFNNTFPIGGDGRCAYMSEGKPSSTWCENKRHWICTRPISDH